jgi:hypothetical protein
VIRCPGRTSETDSSGTIALGHARPPAQKSASTCSTTLLALTAASRASATRASAVSTSARRCARRASTSTADGAAGGSGGSSGCRHVRSVSRSRWSWSARRLEIGWPPCGRMACKGRQRQVENFLWKLRSLLRHSMAMGAKRDRSAVTRLCVASAGMYGNCASSVARCTPLVLGSALARVRCMPLAAVQARAGGGGEEGWRGGGWGGVGCG